jgi:hypothetical protein
MRLDFYFILSSFDLSCLSNYTINNRYSKIRIPNLSLRIGTELAKDGEQYDVYFLFCD